MAKPKKVVRDRHVLYEAAVQSVEAGLDFMERIYRRQNGKRFKRFREDFCGTAALSCEWVKRRKSHQSWGIDLHAPTLAWGRRHRLAHFGDTAERVQLIEGDVLTAIRPPVKKNDEPRSVSKIRAQTAGMQ